MTVFSRKHWCFSDPVAFMMLERCLLLALPGVSVKARTRLSGRGRSGTGACTGLAVVRVFMCVLSEIPEQSKETNE